MNLVSQHSPNCNIFKWTNCPSMSAKAHIMKVYRKHRSPGLCCNFISLALETVLVAIVQSLSCVQLLATPWTVARQAFRSFTVFQSLPKLMSIESVMTSNHFIFCRSLLLLPSIFPSVRVFSNESVLSIVCT